MLTLDLHGLRHEDAKRKLELFINDHWGKRLKVITGHSNGCIKVWDLKSGEIKAIIVDKNRFPPHSDKVTTLNMNKDFQLSGSQFGDYKTYTVKERKIVKNGGKILESILSSVMV